jgi:hypothetical protein
MTMMHTAVVCGDVVAVGILCKHGAWVCLSMLDEYGLLPIDRAYECWLSVRDAERRADFRTMQWMLWTVSAVHVAAHELDPTFFFYAAAAAEKAKAKEQEMGKGRRGKGRSPAKTGQGAAPDDADAGGGGAATNGSADDGTDDAWTRMTGKYTHVELTDSIKQFDARDGMLAAVQNTNIAIMLLWLVFDYDVPGRAVDCIQPGPVFGARYDIARELLLAVCGKAVEVSRLPDLKSKGNAPLQVKLEHLQKQLRTARTTDGLSLLHAASCVFWFFFAVGL